MFMIPWNGRETETMPAVRRLFDDFFPEFDTVLEPASGWSPSLDVSESEKELTVRADMPGVTPEDVEITITGNVLTISGEKKYEKAEHDGDVYRCERSFGSFRRTIELPETVDSKNITAEYENGVLTVRVGKSEAALPRKIEVKKK